MMRQSPRVRPFLPEDWQVYKALRLRALTDAPDAFGSTLAREESFSDARWQIRLVGDDFSLDLPLVAEVDGEPVGLAWGRIEIADPSVANLYQVWIAPEYRGLGIAKILLETIINWAKKKNAHYLVLEVTLRESPAMHLYIRAGFEPVGAPKPLRSGSELSEQQMRLKLR